MGEDTKKSDPQSTNPSSQEQQQKKEETIESKPPALAADTAAQKKDGETTPPTPPQQTITTPPPTPPNPPNNSPTAAPPPDPSQPPNDDTKQGADQGKSWVDVIKDSVTILGGLTVIIVALFVFLGRRFIEGYFSVLNIPISAVNFSTWSYGETGLVYIIAPIGVFIILSPIIVFIFLFISETIFRVIQNIFPQKSIVTPNKTSLFQPILQEVLPPTIKVFCGAIVITLLMRVFLAVSLRMYDEGENNAYQYIQESALGIRLTSKEPFLIPAPTVTAATATANDEPTYTYEGLYLLTKNDGTYFLFDDVDETCRPRDIYIVKEAQLLGVQFLPTKPFSKSCSTPTPVANQTTPTAILPTTTLTPQATPTPMP